MLGQAAGLKTHIWNNNLRSILLIGFYPFIIAALFWVCAFVFTYMFDYSQNENSAMAAEKSIGFAHAALIHYWPLIFTIVGIWFVIAYYFQTGMIRKLSHSHPVTRKEEPELYNILENLAITAGIPMPRLEIIETHARNAFASGIDKKSYTVTVTRGLLQSLDKDEVEAVLAHEVNHILNRDVRLLIISIIFTGMIGFAAQMAWSSIRYSIFARGGGRDRGKAIIVILIIALILWLGYLATMFTRFALSRRREFMADAGAVELTKKPEAMMSALLRISGKESIPQAAGDINLMCIENKNRFMGLFTTHPPIEKRIEALSNYTDTPIPNLKSGARAENRFKEPDHDNPPSWATLAAKKKSGGKTGPWS